MSTTSGKGLKVTFSSGPTIMKGVTTSDVQEVGDELDATDADTAPFTSTDIGCTGLKVQVKGHHREDGINPIALSVGTILTDVSIFPDGVADPGWTMEEAIILPGSWSQSIRGQKEYTLNIASRGPWTAPDNTP